MGIYDLLVHSYFQVLSIFPQPLEFIVNVLILIGLAMAFIGLVRSNILFLFLLVILVPAGIPIAAHIIGELWQFFLVVFHQTAATAPTPTAHP